MKNKILLTGLATFVVAVVALVVWHPSADAQINNYLNPIPAVYALPTNNTPAYGGAGWTNWLQGGTAFENDTKIDTAGAKDVSLQLRFRCAAANSGTVTVALGRNNDGAVGTTNIELFSAFSATANGNTAVTVCTNLSDIAGSGWGAHRYLYIMYITNGGAAAGGMTNYSIVPSLK